MKMQVVTTITSLIDIDTFETTHDAHVEGEASVPESIARAAAIGGCRAILNNFGYDSVEREFHPEEGSPDASPAP